MGELCRRRLYVNGELCRRRLHMKGELCRRRLHLNILFFNICSRAQYNIFMCRGNFYIRKWPCEIKQQLPENFI